MKLGNPIRVADGVYQIRAIGARVTVLFAGGQALLVDAGMRGSSGLIVDGLDSLGVSMNAVRSIVLTHHHPDHAAGVTELVAGRRIAVMAHRLDAAVLAGRHAEAEVGAGRRPLTARIAAPVLHRMNGGPIHVDAELEDGDVVPFPMPVQAIHVPGHTAGSLALYVPDRRLVIVGDSMQHRLGLRLSPPAGAVTEYPEQAIASLEKLMALDFDVIGFSHFPPLRSGGKAALLAMLSERRRIPRTAKYLPGGTDGPDGA